MASKKPTVDEVLKKYGGKIESQISGTEFNPKYSQAYSTFKGEMSSPPSNYERWCKSLGSLVKLEVSSKDKIRIQKFLSIAHLDLEPWQCMTLSVMSFLSVFLIGIIISVAIVLINGGFDSFPFLFFFLMLVLSVFLFYFINGYPERLANSWRLKASSQMVPAILYVVVYMRHTPNLEKAIAFAADHLQYPLSLDFKKVFYNVEIGKFSTIKESLDHYLETWRDYSVEFIEAFHLIESSLFEPDNTRRITILEKSLQVVLDGVYDKMLKFSHSVRSPLTNVYMLGVVLPTLSLALIPLASSMLGGLLNWIHVLVLFNLIVPFFVFYLVDKVLFLRPGGHGETDLLENHPLYTKYKSSAPYAKAFLICLPLFILGLLPLLFGFTPFPELVGLQSDYSMAELGMGFLGPDEMFFGFMEGGAGGISGPFGIGATLLGMLFPLGLALFFTLSYKAKTKDLIIEREKTRNLESEFNSALFQLGNQVGNGVPPEAVFGKVVESSKGLDIEDFFKRINFNIRNAGMSVEKAIFDRNQGAIIFYPSQLIATSMRIFLESSKKGLQVAAMSLMSISEYVKNMKKVTMRLNDMLAEVLSDMKSNMTFLAPLLSGVVVGLAVMITSILGKLNLANLAGEQTIAGLEGIIDLFSVVDMIPPYFLQISVGIYLIQIIFILTGALVTIDAGKDNLMKTNRIGVNLQKGIVLYFVVSLISIIVLFGLASVVLSGLF